MYEAERTKVVSEIKKRSNYTCKKENAGLIRVLKADFELCQRTVCEKKTKLGSEKLCNANDWNNGDLRGKMKKCFDRKKSQFIDKGKMKSYCKSRCEDNTNEKCNEQCQDCSKSALKDAYTFTIDDLVLRPVTNKQEIVLKTVYEKDLDPKHKENDKKQLKFIYHRWGKCIRDNCTNCSKKEQAKEASNLLKCVTNDWKTLSDDFISKMCIKQAEGDKNDTDEKKKADRENCIKKRKLLEKNYNAWMEKSLQDEGSSSRILQAFEIEDKDYSIELATTKAENYNYVLVSCFTGWGSASVKFINEYYENAPSMSVCKQLFPSTSEYGVEKLNTAVDNYYKGV